MKFHPSLGFEHRQSFQSVVDQLPDSIRAAFLTYLTWRNAPISPLDYNLACTFRDHSRNRLAGDGTNHLLCESLRAAIEGHTVIGVFRHHFDAEWRKRAEEFISAKARKKKEEALLQNYREHQLAGRTYSGETSLVLRRKGWIHRKPGHS